jgi:hypothetical protein
MYPADILSGTEEDPMKRWLGSLALALALVSAAPAHAKKDKKSKGIQETGIESFDALFADVASIDKRLTNANKVLGSAKKELNTTLGLKKGTPLSDAIKELNARADGKIGLAMNGKIPTLEPTDAVPTDVQTGIASVNQLNSDIVTSIEDLTQVGKELDAIIKKSKSFPDDIRKEFADDSLLDKIFKMPKAAKATGHNLGITKDLPGKTEKVLAKYQDLEKTVRNEFKPVERGGGGAGGGRPDTVGPGKGRAGGGDGSARKPGSGGGTRDGRSPTARPGSGKDISPGTGGGKKKKGGDTARPPRR